jgi:hypothetical protein
MVEQERQPWSHLASTVVLPCLMIICPTLLLMPVQFEGELQLVQKEGQARHSLLCVR